jgi:sec-independent protein translocase protein TatA
MLNSPVDIALLFGVALLIFGPKKLPEIGKALGQGLGNFKRSISDAQDEVKSAIKAAEDKPQSNQPVQPVADIGGQGAPLGASQAKVDPPNPISNP